MPNRHLSLLALSLLLPLTTTATASDLRVRADASLDLAWYDDDHGGRADHALQEALGIYNVHDHGDPLRRGLNLQRAQLGTQLQAGEWGHGRLSLVAVRDEVRLDEAWLAGRLGDTGLQLRAGKFYSGIGLLNAVQMPEWAFADRPLPYRMLLDDALRGRGVQLEWLPRFAPWLQLGTEWMNTGNPGVAGRVNGEANAFGIRLPFAGAPEWPALRTAYARTRIPLGAAAELHLGGWQLDSRLHQELHDYHPGINEADHGLQGKARMYGAQVAWVTRPDAAGRGWRVEGEYWDQRKDLTLVYHQLKPVLVGQPRDLRVDGAYLQVVHDLSPRWQAGLRHDRVGMTHRASRARATVGPRITSYFDDMERTSLALTWRPRAQQHLRLQWSRASAPVPEDRDDNGRDESVRRRFDQWWLQYQIAFATR
ncbi:hypothetical protein [Thermomonas flagellata]|uniref:hypothetical protein n=1 Tax=Thermomonas flagellata TaxID=2888524 RepID=UPI001F044C31|nr:hypothetical protein [Thermomonas flagellata]